MIKKAIQIDSINRIVKEVTYNDYKEMYPLLNCDIYTIGGYLANGDTLFVDDEGLLKDKQVFFKIDGVGQEFFAGNGLIVGIDDEGESISNKTDLNELRRRITFFHDITEAKKYIKARNL